MGKPQSTLFIFSSPPVRSIIQNKEQIAIQKANSNLNKNEKPCKKNMARLQIAASITSHWLSRCQDVLKIRLLSEFFFCD